MKRPTEWNDRLVIEDGKITRIVEAEYRQKKRGEYIYHSIDVFKHNENEEYQARNLYQSMWGGYVVAFPGLPFNDRYGDKTPATEEEWCECGEMNFCGSTLRPSRSDIELVCGKYPDFRYVCNKYSIASRRMMIDILIMWKKHPQIELILAAGFYNVAMSGQFWRMTEANRKKICDFMRKYPKFCNFSFKDVWDCVKSGNPEKFAQFLRDVPSYYRHSRYYYSVKFEDYGYLCKLDLKEPRRDGLDAKIRYWQDYMDMLEKTHHEITDVYWRHPRDIKSAHDKLVKELEEIENEKMKEKIAQMEKIVARFKKFESNVDGYEIFVTSNYEVWNRQAKYLHQCIVANGYYNKVLDGNCVIIFIQKDGDPVATAEVKNDGKLGQFYADELDRSNCLPAPEVRAAFEKWMAAIPKNRFKPRREKERNVA